MAQSKIFDANLFCACVILKHRKNEYTYIHCQNILQNNPCRLICYSVMSSVTHTMGKDSNTYNCGQKCVLIVMSLIIIIITPPPPPQAPRYKQAAHTWPRSQAFISHSSLCYSSIIMQTQGRAYSFFLPPKVV